MSVLPHHTSLLPASAGTGKTFRIVDLLLSLVVEEGQDLDRVVVVTFTEAAAGELRDRIRQRLADARDGLEHRSTGRSWDGPDPVLRDWVERQVVSERASHCLVRLQSTLTAFDTACITTLHGFCTRVLTEAAFEAGAPFATELIGDAKTVARDVVADFWLRHTWDAPPATLRSFDALRITRRSLLDLAEKAMNPDLLIVPDDPGRPDPIDLTDWRSLVDRIQHQTSDASARDLLLDSTALARRTSKNQPVSMPAGRTKKSFDALRAWLNADPVPAPELPEWATFLSAEHVLAATKQGQKPPQHPLLDAIQALNEEHITLGPALTAWRLSLQHEVIRGTRERVAHHLRRRNALTFDEMLRRVRVPLTCPQRGGPLRAAVRQRYDAALVDEFQDTDADQWDIFRELFRDRLYLVGDPKQAIYSFRGADFRTYLRAEADCEPVESLDTNYRSDEALVKAVNRLFCRDAVSEPFFTAGIDFPEVTANRTSRGIVGDERAPLHIRYLGRDGKKLQNYRWLRNGDLQRDLPSLVANDIVRQLQRGERLQTPDGERLIGPGDCAVLVRKNAHARAIARALIARGVPATTRSDGSVLHSAAFTEFTVVLRAIHDPLKTALVRRALLTELLGVSAADLVALQDDHDRWGQHAARFRTWRRLWDEQGVLAVTRALLDEGGVASRLLAQGRERRVTDLRHLGELCQRVSAERRLTPTALLGWIEEGCPGLDEDAVKLRQETDAAAVQCVTVFGAKGLEYPLVWAPWLHAGSWVAPLQLEHLVIADPHHPGARRIDLGSVDKPALVQAKRDAAIAEDLRLIYVALTRARHRLVVYHGASGKDAALTWLLHQNAGMKPDRTERWKQVQGRLSYRSGGDTSLLEDLDSLASPGLIAWDRVDWADARKQLRWEPTTRAESTLTASMLSRRTAPDRSWGRTSFTGLTRQVHDFEPHPEVDHDADAPEVPLRSADLPLAAIRGSAQFGVAVHSILEHHDFSAGPTALRAVVGSTLVGHDLPAAWADPVAEQLQRSLEAPLLEGFRLADLDPTDRWDELDFALPVRGDGSRFRVDGLRAAFDGPLGAGLDAGWHAQLERLDFLPVHGFLVGSIDLVFRWNGRWYLADYKSNRLGDDRSAYAAESLRQPMYKSLYPLQYHLYTVALVRLLRSRIPGFDVERDFGGALYLFVRGMDAAHPQHGVFFDRPPTALIERLDRALGGERRPRLPGRRR